MKTIHQRLQSRISKRRNVIREAESEVAMLVRQRQWLRDDRDCKYADWVYVVEGVTTGRKSVASLAADQKLDKQLANVLTGVARQRRPSDFEASW